MVTDYGNNRVKVVDASGTVTNLYGVNSDFWVRAAGFYPGWWDGTVARGDINYNIKGSVESRSPVAVAFGVGDHGGEIYTTETYYHIIRVTTESGLRPLVPPRMVPSPRLPLLRTRDTIQWVSTSRCPAPTKTSITR